MLKATEELGIRLKSFVLVFVVSEAVLLGCDDLAQLGGEAAGLALLVRGAPPVSLQIQALRLRGGT